MPEFKKNRLDYRSASVFATVIGFYVWSLGMVKHYHQLDLQVLLAPGVPLTAYAIAHIWRKVIHKQAVRMLAAVSLAAITILLMNNAILLLAGLTLVVASTLASFDAVERSQGC